MSFNYEVRLLGNLSKMLDNESFHDLTIGLNEVHGSIRANKAILCSNSTYFASFFNNNSLENEAQNVDIKIPTTLESMKLVIRFLYTGKLECDSLSMKDIFDLLRLGKPSKKENC